MKKFLLGSSLAIGTALSSFAAAPTYTTAKVSTDLTAVADSASALFDVVAPIVIAVVALGVLITFVKRVKKG